MWGPRMIKFDAMPRARVDGKDGQSSQVPSREFASRFGIKPDNAGEGFEALQGKRGG